MAHHVLHGLGTFETEPPDVEEMGHAMLQSPRPAFRTWWRVEGGRVVGYAYANHFRTRAAYGTTVEDSVYVAPDAVGRGSARPC